jgi:CRP-like cAMP-binding protein
VATAFRGSASTRHLTLDAIPFLPTASAPLSPRHREQLMSIATELRLPRHARVYESGEPADALYIITGGVARSWRPVTGRHRHIVAFLLQNDLFGLARRGVYVNTVDAVTPLGLLRFPLEPLTAMLRGNPDLQFRVLCRVTHALRESQRRGVLAARSDLTGRLAMVLSMLEESQSAGRPAGTTIPLPLAPADLAEFIGSSTHAVVRAFKDLEQQHIVAREGRHAVRVLDRARFQALAAG